MTTRPATIPASVLPEFRQFRRQFDAITAVCVSRGEESHADVELMRENLRRYLSDPADPDEHGVSRADRLADVFAFWRALFERLCPDGVPIRPVLSAESDARAADRAWQRKRGGR